jgi:hypothetical protein
VRAFRRDGLHLDEKHRTQSIRGRTIDYDRLEAEAAKGHA